MSHVQVGVGVLVFKAGRVLIGKRKNSLGVGTWGVPGGKLEFGETAIQAAAREVAEETGLVLNKVVDIDCTTNDYFAEEQKHFITLWVCAAVDPDNLDVVNMEPDKCEGWEWHDLNNLPTPLFLPLAKIRDVLIPTLTQKE